MTITESRSTADERGASAAVRPFTIAFPDTDLHDLRRRVLETRLPENELVADASQGVQLQVIDALAQYWANGHDWRSVESRLNNLLSS